MAIRVVAIAHTDGAGGASVGQAVAKHLGFTYVDEALIEQVAESLGVDHAVVADAERRKAFLGRVMEHLIPEGNLGGAKEPWRTPPGRNVDYMQLIRDAVWEAANRGDAVIVAHAASFVLANRPDVLRVFITASEHSRAERLAASGEAAEGDAAAMVRRADASRASYLKGLYGVDHEDASHYDLAVNTERLDVDTAVELVLLAAAHAVPAN